MRVSFVFLVVFYPSIAFSQQSPVEYETCIRQSLSEEGKTVSEIMQSCQASLKQYLATLPPEVRSSVRSEIRKMTRQFVRSQKK